MDNFYIETDWLDAVRNTLFFYPAAGSDYVEPLKVFQNQINTFWFCDSHYPKGLDLPNIFQDKKGLSLICREKSGAQNAAMERRYDECGRRYRYLKPSSLSDTYVRSDGRQFCVVRRRGFGQIAVTVEFSPRTIGVFMHRGDSIGEGGSNVYFLANKMAFYEPCRNLFDKLGEQLTDKALVITDGSNSSIAQLIHFHNKDTEGSMAYEYYRGTSFHFGDFRWSCVGWLPHRYGPTLAWGLHRQGK